MKRASLLLLLSLVSLPTAADAGLDSARALFQSGLEHAKRGAWSTALDAFVAAYQLAPEPAVLFNLAGAQSRCGKLLASNSNYRRLLAGEVLTDHERDAVQRQLALLERRMPRLRVHIDGLSSDDRLLLDRGRLYADELDRDMWVDPGTHALQVVRAHGRPEERTLAMAEGELRVLALSLR